MSQATKTKYNTEADKQIKCLSLIKVKTLCPFYPNTARY